MKTMSHKAAVRTADALIEALREHGFPAASKLRAEIVSIVAHPKMGRHQKLDTIHKMARAA